MRNKIHNELILSDALGLLQSITQHTAFWGFKSTQVVIVVIIIVLFASLFLLVGTCLLISHSSSSHASPMSHFLSSSLSLIFLFGASSLNSSKK